MKKLRVRIMPTSAFGSPLMSDTLWGQTCLAALEITGREGLESLLGTSEDTTTVGGNAADAEKSTKAQAPFALFSDGFPADLLPKPRLAPFRVADLDYDEIKEAKKQRLVRTQVLLEERHRLTGPGLAARLRLDRRAREAAGGGSRTQARMRNSISRQTGRVLGGALFTSREIFYDRGLDLYAAFDEQRISKSRLLELLSYVGETGYGRDRSVGLGRFEIGEVVEDPPILEPLGEANAFMTLSRGVPCSDCRLYHGATHTKFGRHGGEWALKGNPFKNPVVLYEPGSTFRIENAKESYGRALENVSANPGRHLHAAWLLPSFLRLEES